MTNHDEWMRNMDKPDWVARIILCCFLGVIALMTGAAVNDDIGGAK